MASSIPFPDPATPRSDDDGDEAAITQLLTSLESLAAGRIPASLLASSSATSLRLLEAMRLASLRLEQPWDTMQRLVFCALPPNIARLGVDLGLWRLLATRDGAASSVEELAEATGAEEALLRRVLRYAATQWMVERVGVDAYRATGVTRCLAMEGMEAVVFHVTERNIGLYSALPKWLANNAYKQPQDNKNLPFNLSQETDLHFFEWLAQRPRHQQAFNEYMSFQRVGQKSWLDVFPLGEYVADHSSAAGNEHRTLFVDVGGGHGHQCREVLRRFPGLQGRVVLQDTHAAAIDSAKAIAGLEVVHHDFTKAQPVKGARVYYLRNILHDWPAEACCTILSRLKDALAPDSIILLDELVIRDDGVHWYGASFDLLMMANYGARERSLAEWDGIFEATGLERKMLVPYSMHGDSIQIVGARAPSSEKL